MSVQSTAMRYPFLSLLALATATLSAQTAEPIPEFNRDDAKRILEAQEWHDVTIIAVVNGVSKEKIASPSLSHALAFGRRYGKWADIKFDAYYDRALGWFTYESSPEGYRVWNREGYREFKPGLGWQTVK